MKPIKRYVQGRRLAVVVQTWNGTYLVKMYACEFTGSASREYFSSLAQAGARAEQFVSEKE
jgi:hypothetical protein